MRGDVITWPGTSGLVLSSDASSKSTLQFAGADPSEIANRYKPSVLWETLMISCGVYNLSSFKIWSYFSSEEGSADGYHINQLLGAIDAGFFPALRSVRKMSFQLCLGLHVLGLRQS